MNLSERDFLGELQHSALILSDAREAILVLYYFFQVLSAQEEVIITDLKESI